jgi:hypothetical protein
MSFSLFYPSPSFQKSVCTLLLISLFFPTIVVFAQEQEMLVEEIAPPVQEESLQQVENPTEAPVESPLETEALGESEEAEIESEDTEELSLLLNEDEAIIDYAKTVFESKRLARVNDSNRQISSYYSSIQSFTNGQTVRNWVSSQSFQSQMQFGKTILKKFTK